MVTCSIAFVKLCSACWRNDLSDNAAEGARRVEAPDLPLNLFWRAPIPVAWYLMFSMR